MVSLLTGLGKGYCCILLSQIRPKSKVLSSQISFCAHTSRIAMRRWSHVIAGSSAPISPIRNLFSQNQHVIERTGEQIVMVERPEVVSQPLPSFRYKLCCLPELSKCIGTELECLPVKDLNSTDSKTHVCYL